MDQPLDERSGRAASRRMERLERIIIILIAVSTLL